MGKLRVHFATGLSAVAIFAAMYGLYFLTHTAEFTKQRDLERMLAGNRGQLVLGAAIKSSGCMMRGSLPDPDCSPGAVFSETTKAKICVSGYTKTVRNVSEALKRQIYAEYDIFFPPPTGTYEADHLIPLALGGSNDASNLWPEAAAHNLGELGFKEKDVVENYLHEQVCAGEADLTAAQQAIARNWVLIYQSMTEGKIREMKARYKSWAN